MWHKLTTYEYIVQHRPPQEAKGAQRELESCPTKMRPIQVYKWPRGLRGWEMGLSMYVEGVGCAEKANKGTRQGKQAWSSSEAGHAGK